MEGIKIRQKAPLKTACPHCSADYHNWSRVYVDNGIQLIEVLDQFIAWCNKKGQFVITEKK